MSREFEMLEKLGESVAVELGVGPSEERLIIQRRDFLAEVADRKRSHRGVYWGVAAAAAMVAVFALAVFFIGVDRTVAVPFWVGDSGVAGQEGQWVRTETDAALEIQFEGGTLFTLSPNAAARMVRANGDEVRVDLASGKLNCNINKGKSNKWQVVAGPYTITVTGTIFNAEWEPGPGNLSVDVSRGSVLVSGADLSEHGVRLAKGDHLRVDGERAVISLSGDTSEAETTIEDDLPLDEEVEDEQILDESYPSLVSKVQKKSQHRKKRPVSMVNDDDPNTMSLDSLWQAASKARFKKRADEAEILLMTVRKRFAGTRQAQAVPFLMGRIYLEQKGNPTEAINWFGRYLKESPSGPLAEEALGRMIDAARRAGDKARAERYAKTYLKKYGRGLFQDLAESVLTQ